MVMQEKLVQLRKEKGLTQIELAEALDVSRQAVSKWESGGALPATENLIFLSKLYGVTIDYLVNDEGERPVPTETKEAGASENRNRKWVIGVVCGLIAVIMIAAVGIGAAIMQSQREPEVLDFSMLEKEDWNGLETDVIHIEWE